MNKLSIIIALLLVSVIGFAQTTDQHNVKRIEVSGKAEMEIVPDEIYIRIALKEYKDGSKLININTLESGLVKAVNQLGLPKESLTVDNIYGYNWDWKKKKADDFLATKSFILKANNVKMLNDLIGKLDAEGVNSMSIASVSHSKMEDYKMDLKIKALQSAKQKASDLLGAIGEQLGGAIDIQEIDNGYAPVYARNNMMMKAEMDNYQSELEYKNISIQAEVRAVFAIK